MYDTLSYLKVQAKTFPTIDISYHPSKPVTAPIIVTLSANGLRLRFDGIDQRLRLIEVLNFSKSSLTYDGKDVVKSNDMKPQTEGAGQVSNGPSFRYVYDKLLGPSFPGEYFHPRRGSGETNGKYILSYPGIAFSFTLPASSWLPDENFVAILSSPAVGPASSMVIFSGPSWQETCVDLYSRPCPNPRSSVPVGRSKEPQVDELERIRVSLDSKITLLRRSLPPFEIVLGETTPQDLLAELGPPDAIYAKSDRRLSIHRVLNDESRASSKQRDGPLTKYEESLDTGRSSANTTTDESGDDTRDGVGPSGDGQPENEYFYNYFQHGLDVFVSTAATGPNSRLGSGERATIGTNVSHRLVVAKVLLHGNIPGSYTFNRYRRSRWVIDHQSEAADGQRLDSEAPFATVGSALERLLPASARSSSRVRGMPINRDWDSPGSSCELLGDWEEEDGNAEQVSQNAAIPANSSTEIFGFPGLIFEVLKNDTISCLTVY